MMLRASRPLPAASSAAAWSHRAAARAGSFVCRPLARQSRGEREPSRRSAMVAPLRRRPPLQTTTTSTSTSATAAFASAALASATFSAATVAAVCAYAALVTRPRSRIALFLTSSPLLPLTGCLAYLLAALLFWPGAVSRAAAAAVAASSPLPNVAAFASLFASSPGATALTWLHLLAGDFAAAAWVVRDARRLGESSLFASSDDDDDDEVENENKDNNKRKRNKLQRRRPTHFPCAVSVVLCFMTGPLGILSHLLTRRVWYRMGWGSEGGGGGGVEGGGGGAEGTATAATPALSTF